MTSPATHMSANVVLKAMWSPRYDCSNADASGATMGARADIDTSMAVPIEAATWLRVLDTPCACWMTLLSSELTPHVFSGVMVNCKPTTSTV